MPRKSLPDDFFKRALHRLLARGIRQDPAIVDRAKAKVAEWEKKASQPVPLYVLAWKEILSNSNEEIARIITLTNMEMERWRCSTPFVEVCLSIEDRRRLLRKLRKLKQYGYDPGRK